MRRKKKTGVTYRKKRITTVTYGSFTRPILRCIFEMRFVVCKHENAMQKCDAKLKCNNTMATCNTKIQCNNAMQYKNVNATSSRKMHCENSMKKCIEYIHCKT
jgi:hypothetical protein